MNLKCSEAVRTLCSVHICTELQTWMVQQGWQDVHLPLDYVYFCDTSASARSDYRRQEKACSAQSYAASFAATSLQHFPVAE